MLIRDLPTKWKLVRRGQEVYWQRYHYRERPTLIPDEAFSRALQELLTDENNFKIRHDFRKILTDGRQLNLSGAQHQDEPARVVVPSAMQDWRRLKTEVIKRVSLWAFPMQLHLTDEYLNRVLQTNTDNWGSHDLLSMLYTYSSPAEALQFLTRLGKGVLRKRKPLDWGDRVWWWLFLSYHDLESAVADKGHFHYLLLPNDVAQKAYIKCDYRLLWRHVREWLPLLVDINARQIAWQLEGARRYGITPSDWTKRELDDEDAEQFILGDIECSLSIAPVDARIRRYLTGDALRYYEQVYKALQESNPDEFDRGKEAYQRFLDALGS